MSAKFGVDNGDLRVLTKYAQSFIYKEEEEEEVDKQRIHNHLMR